VEDELELDLRKYVDVLIKRWWMIAALTLLSASVAWMVGRRSPPVTPVTYEATAVCLATTPKYDMRFEPRMTSFSMWPYSGLPAGLAKVYAAVAKNAQLEKQIVTSMGYIARGAAFR